MSAVNVKCRHCDTWELNAVSKGEGCLGRTPALIVRKARFWLLCYWWVTKSCPTPAIPWTVAHQASLSMEFSRQEYWSGLPFPSPGDLPDPGIEPKFSCIVGKFFHQLSCEGSPILTIGCNQRCLVSSDEFLHPSGSPSGPSVTQGEVDQMVKPDFPIIHPVFS